MNITINNSTHKIPNILQNNDSIIIGNEEYILEKKIYNIDSDDLTGIVQFKARLDAISITSLMCRLYEKDYFKTSGANTNEIQNHPKLIILITILGIITGSECKEYITNVIKLWNTKYIMWGDIITDNPTVKIYDEQEIKSLTEEIIKSQKINTDLLPWNSLKP
jgi:hypothetical protein